MELALEGIGRSVSTEDDTEIHFKWSLHSSANPVFLHTNPMPIHNLTVQYQTKPMLILNNFFQSNTNPTPILGQSTDPSQINQSKANHVPIQSQSASSLPIFVHHRYRTATRIHHSDSDHRNNRRVQCQFRTNLTIPCQFLNNPPTFGQSQLTPGSPILHQLAPVEGHSVRTSRKDLMELVLWGGPTTLKMPSFLEPQANVAAMSIQCNCFINLPSITNLFPIHHQSDNPMPILSNPCPILYQLPNPMQIRPSLDRSIVNPSLLALTNKYTSLATFSNSTLTSLIRTTATISIGTGHVHPTSINANRGSICTDISQRPEGTSTIQTDYSQDSMICLHSTHTDSSTSWLPIHRSAILCQSLSSQSALCPLTNQPICVHSANTMLT